MQTMKQFPKRKIFCCPVAHKTYCSLPYTKASPKHPPTDATPLQCRLGFSKVGLEKKSQQLQKIKDDSAITKNCSNLSSAVNRQSFQLSPDKPQKPSRYAKDSRKSGLLLRMEIFVGTYMRPRYSPCQSLGDTSNKPKATVFWQTGHFITFKILFLAKKHSPVFS
jgi:hypothetical protein